MFRKAAIALLVLCSVAFADTIVLRNGRKITANNVHEDAGGSKYSYEIGGNTFSIARSSVDHVDKDGQATSIPKGQSRLGACKPAPKKTQPEDKAPVRVVIMCQQLSAKRLLPGIPDAAWNNQCARIIQNGSVDDQVLTDTESECNSDLSAASYYLAGNFEYTAAKLERALDYLKIANLYRTGDYEVLSKLAIVSRDLGQFDDSLTYFQQLADLGGSEWLPSLGTAYYLVGRKEEALVTWKTYLASGDSRSGYSVDNYVYLAEQLKRKYGKGTAAPPYNPYANNY